MDKPSDYNRDDFALKHIDVDLAYDIMSTPTVYNVEYRLVTYIILAIGWISLIILPTLIPFISGISTSRKTTSTELYTI